MRVYNYWAGNRRYRNAKCDHFRGNCFGRVIRQISGHCESLLADCESLFKWIRHKTPFLQNFHLFRQILCVGCKNVNKFRIMIRNCESLCHTKCIAIATRRPKSSESLFVSLIQPCIYVCIIIHTHTHIYK